MEREDRIGAWVSGLTHGGLILWLLLAGALFRPSDRDPAEAVQVGTMTEADFQAMAAAARGPGPLADGSAQPPAALPPQPDLPAPPATPTAPPPAPADAPAAPALPGTSTTTADAPPPEPAAPLSPLALDTSRMPRARPDGLVEAARARAEAARLAALAAEQAEAEAIAAARAEAERIEADRIAAERREAEQAEAARAEAERIAREQAEAEAAARQAQAEQARREQEQAAQEQAERERAEAEARAAEAARIEAERQEAERLEAERREQARIEQERLERERAERERAERERAERERLEQERIEQARLEQERLERERLEQEQAAEAERQRELDRLAEEARRIEAEQMPDLALPDPAAPDDLDRALAEALAGPDPDAEGAFTDPDALDDPDLPRGPRASGVPDDELTHSLDGARTGRVDPIPDDMLTAAMEDALENTPQAPSSIAQAGSEAPVLTSHELGVLMTHIGECWKINMLSMDAQDVVISVEVRLDRAGVPLPDGLELVGWQGGSEAAAQNAFEVAARAIRSCGEEGLDLPADKYDRWQRLILDFDPRRMTAHGG